MESMRQVKVGYTPVVGTVLLVLALLNIVLGVMSHTGMSTAMGGLFTVIAILQLTMPYFVLTDGAVQLRNLLGMTVRQYVFTDLAQFEVEEDGKRIYLRSDDGERKRVKLTRWLAQRGDWQRFMTALSARAFD